MWWYRARSLCVALVACLLYLAGLWCYGPSAFAADTKRANVGWLVAWVDIPEEQRSFWQSVRHAVDSATDLVIRMTSPDFPPEERRLWIISIDGQTRRLTSKQYGARNPTWGKRDLIAYEIESDTNGDGAIDFHDELRINVVNSDGTAEYSVGEGKSPVWSPDGERLAFVRNGEIWIHQVGGRTSRYGERRFLGRLIFSDKSTSALAQNFWVLDLERRSVRPVKDGYKGSLAWLRATSLDRKMLVFHDSMRSDIFIRRIGAAAEDEVNITRDDYICADPAWSPDGRAIVYVSNRP